MRREWSALSIRNVRSNWATSVFTTALIVGSVRLAGAQITFATMAGRGNIGSADGIGAAARFQNPEGVAVDSAGNVYVADEQNHTIRKITPAGVVTTLAGLAGDRGISDGIGSAARFYFPVGVAVDIAGNVYVAEGYDIRKITPAGVVTTLAGGAPGSTDGIGTAARFWNPRGITVDSATGMLYVADTGNHTIRAIVIATGAVTTLAGSAGTFGSVDGIGSAARFGWPLGVSINPGNHLLYVADNSNNNVRLVDVAPGPTLGKVTTWGPPAAPCGAQNGPIAIARFCGPTGISVDPATWNVYVADAGSNLIRKITPAGVVSTLAGRVGLCGSVDGTGTVAGFCAPVSVAHNAATGVLYVAERSGNVIRAVTSAGVVTTFASVLSRGFSDGGASTSSFNEPNHVAVNTTTGVLYVADYLNHTIRAIDPDGAVTTLAGQAQSPGFTNASGSTARFRYPAGIGVDPVTGIIYVADAGNHAIRAVTPAGVVTTLAGNGSSGSADGTGSAASFNGPLALAVNRAAGVIYLADSRNNAIRLVTFGGVVTTWAGQAGTRGSANGVGATARFDFPGGITFDPATWTVYVADTNTAIIRRIDPATAHVTTLAGLAGSLGYVDGPGPAARFYYPLGVGFFGGRLYIADGATVRVMTEDGVVSRVAGDGTQGDTDGAGPRVRFRFAFGLCVDASGTVYVSDIASNTIRMGEVLMPLAADVDHDGQGDFALFGPNSGRWRARLTSDPTDDRGFVSWGRGGDLPVPGDYNGDGLLDVGVYRPSDNTWHILVQPFDGGVELHLAWGTPGDLPVPGDYDGDGKTDIAVYRPSTFEWFIITSSNSQLLQVGWGTPGDLPVRGDFDGDGKTDIAVYRPSTFEWFIITSTNSQLLHVTWGTPGDRPAPADYDGDGRSDITVYRPSTGEWFVITSTNSQLLYVVWGGAASQMPLPEDYDGDGKTDITVFDAATSTWYIIQSTASTGLVVNYP